MLQFSQKSKLRGAFILILTGIGAWVTPGQAATNLSSAICQGHIVEASAANSGWRDVSSILNFSGTGLQFPGSSGAAIPSFRAERIGHLWEDESTYRFAREGGPLFQGPDPMSLKTMQPMAVNPMFELPVSVYPQVPVSMGPAFSSMFY